MRRRKKTTVDINLSDPQYYFNRELSWLEFNNRVLHEAFDPRTPLLERLKFLGIFGSNLDEYFMVRVAALKEQVDAQVTKLTPDGRTPQEQLDLIGERLHPLVQKQHHHFDQALRPQLAAQGIFLLNYIDLSQEQRTYLQTYFHEQVFPVLTPLAIDPSHPFPYISNLSLNLAVVIKDGVTGEELFARVKVPKMLPRFIALPIETQTTPTSLSKSRATVWAGVPVEQVIAHNLEPLFPGMNIQEYHPFRITRNADLEVEEDEADDLMLAIEQELRKRRFGGSVVRMEINSSMPAPIREMLMRELGIDPTDIYDVEGILCLRDLMSFLELPLPDLKDPPWTAIKPARLRRVNEIDVEKASFENDDNFFGAIRKQDLLVHHPYDSFSRSVQRFIEEAAHDPNVLAIKMTLYRTSGDSPIVQALITAAENGKQVAALVELKARFDEENNINWAKKLESAGVHVVYGLVGLKTHTKLTLVVRREDGHIRRYVHVGTGNYNPKTARLYTDLGLFSCREDLGADTTDLFNFLTGYSRQKIYRKLLVAPVNLRDRMLEFIQREVEHQRNGRQGRIVAKMNALVDPQIIAALYEASQAGVQIDLIVRGICCLRPGIKDVSETIRVVSIVGRFLEHSRVFYFHNDGQSDVFIGSADWMPRNLDRRVEAVVPVEEPSLAQDLQEILGILLADNRQAWDLQSDGRYIQRCPEADQPEQSAQKILMEMARSAPHTPKKTTVERVHLSLNSDKPELGELS
ncbi:polyphosphate kinase 1 [Myxacorys almedinensis]|uniref:Polyphosphate kinase n=1 Tax=Myxacorys almedinensis A TaxID=2690445 RepID=A0A8J7Z4C8_9CYAN|nr:polyphosphate kinase 1 [Myxacorys almedinensis]NDJ16228.1 polyphosphate kinase 1 [Myxacorys almedinensis A]